jgi:hypothetical protein
LAVSVAVMVNVPVVPVASDVARPNVPKTVPVVTDVTSDEVQAAAVVQSISVPLEKTAKALNCWVVPAAMVGLEGVMTIVDSFPPREQLMKPAAAAKSAAATILPYLRIFIIPFSPDTRLKIVGSIVSESFYIFNDKAQNPRGMRTWIHTLHTYPRANAANLNLPLLFLLWLR